MVSPGVNSPKVSIGMPVFNGANYLRRSLKSLLAQDYEDFELIISDNASTDQTESICREFAKSDHRVRYFRNEINLGAARNYNKVFELAKGAFFKWAAHDDECHPSMIRRCVTVLEQAPKSVSMVYPLAELIDEEGNTLRAGLDRIASTSPKPHQRLARLLWSLTYCDPIFGLFRTEYLKNTQLIGPFFGADYVLLGELAMLGEIWEVDEVLFRLREHPKRSHEAHQSARARAAWYDPTVIQGFFIMPDWERMVWELLKSAWGAPVPLADKLKCCLVIPRMHYWRRFRNAGGRMKNRMLSLCRESR